MGPIVSGWCCRFILFHRRRTGTDGTSVNLRTCCIKSSVAVSRVSGGRVSWGLRRCAYCSFAFILRFVAWGVACFVVAYRYIGEQERRASVYCFVGQTVVCVERVHFMAVFFMCVLPNKYYRVLCFRNGSPLAYNTRKPLYTVMSTASRC